MSGGIGSAVIPASGKKTLNVSGPWSGSRAVTAQPPLLLRRETKDCQTYNPRPLLQRY